MTTIPSPGLGTSGNDDADQCAETVRNALDVGYRHIDTAQMYDNEAAVGEGIAASEVPREEVFLATKVHPSNLAPEDVRETTEASLDRLGTDYVDLLYVHWPMGAYDAEATLPALDDLYDEGRAENVAVSNFTPDLLDEAREILDAPVAANQVEMHPLLPQDDLLAHCRERDVTVVAYSPLMQGEAGDVDALAEIAATHDTTPESVSLAWLRQRDGVVPIPKATGEDHLRANFETPDLSSDEVARIDAVEERERLVDPDDAAWN
ncbi:aldo/keto reductase [Halorussus gelatinilyticus]|uniref:Aldo/keto reductase n=1 Tax=Halorussus gelatinilyticus TaxID=2937524 RepID=A0A8U0ILK1_9EURY|nr:aldo/keto reductase [Halorussus gelatinilyticus]UPW01525.1 aldo/keto reductase [Halorussus gelatinilyticus]